MSRKPYSGYIPRKLRSFLMVPLLLMTDVGHDPKTKMADVGENCFVV